MSGHRPMRELPRKSDSLGERLWRLRFELERGRRHGDESLIWLGDLANLLEEHGIDGPWTLRVVIEEGLRDVMMGAGGDLPCGHCEFPEDHGETTTLE